MTASRTRTARSNDAEGNHEAALSRQRVAHIAFVRIAVTVVDASPRAATASIDDEEHAPHSPPSPDCPTRAQGTGDFDGDANLDVAYLCGNNLGVMVAPAIFE